MTEVVGLSTIILFLTPILKGERQTKKLKGRDFIGLKDFSREAIETILNLAFELKRKLYTSEPHSLLADKNLMKQRTGSMFKKMLLALIIS